MIDHPKLFASSSNFNTSWSNSWSNVCINFKKLLCVINSWSWSTKFLHTHPKIFCVIIIRKLWCMQLIFLWSQSLMIDQQLWSDQCCDQKFFASCWSQTSNSSIKKLIRIMFKVCKHFDQLRIDHKLWSSWSSANFRRWVRELWSWSSWSWCNQLLRSSVPLERAHQSMCVHKNFGDQVSQLPNFDHNFVSPNFATHTHQLNSELRSCKLCSWSIMSCAQLFANFGVWWSKLCTSCAKFGDTKLQPLHQLWMMQSCHHRHHPDIIRTPIRTPSGPQLWPHPGYPGVPPKQGPNPPKLAHFLPVSGVGIGPINNTRSVPKGLVRKR